MTTVLAYLQRSNGFLKRIELYVCQGKTCRITMRIIRFVALKRKLQLKHIPNLDSAGFITGYRTPTKGKHNAQTDGHG